MSPARPLSIAARRHGTLCSCAVAEAGPYRGARARCASGGSRRRLNAGRGCGPHHQRDRGQRQWQCAAAWRHATVSGVSPRERSKPQAAGGTGGVRIVRRRPFAGECRSGARDCCARRRTEAPGGTLGSCRRTTPDFTSGEAHRPKRQRAEPAADGVAAAGARRDARYVPASDCPCEGLPACGGREPPRDIRACVRLACANVSVPGSSFAPRR